MYYVTVPHLIDISTCSMHTWLVTGSHCMYNPAEEGGDNAYDKSSHADGRWSQ